MHTLGRRLQRVMIGVGLTLLATACGDSFGPRVGDQYALRSIDDRTLPTHVAVGLPADTLYPVYSGAQFRVVSDSIIAYDLRIDFVARHPDGSLTIVPSNCWDNYPFRYTRQGDSLLLRPAAHLTVPPPPAPVIHVRDGQLLADLDVDDGKVRMRFELDDHPSAPCGGFMQVAVSR
jgi:hypothetical protein